MPEIELRSGDASGMHGPNAYVWVTPKPAKYIFYQLIGLNPPGASSVRVDPSTISMIDAIVDNPNNSNSVINIFYQDEGYSGEAYLMQSLFLQIYENRAVVKEPQPQLQPAFFGFPIQIDYMTW